MVSNFFFSTVAKFSYIYISVSDHGNSTKELSTGASSIREPSVIKINASDEDGDESMADKTSEEELGKYSYFLEFMTGPPTR